MDEDELNPLPDHDDELSAVEGGEYIDLDDEGDDVIDTPDGGAIVRLDEDEEEARETEFYANLAEEIPDPDLRRLAAPLLDLIARDKEARKKRDEQYEEGLRRTGLGNDAPGGAKFEGASNVVHPMLTEACVDFAARSIKELWPAGGPAKDHIEGTETSEKRAKAIVQAVTHWKDPAVLAEVSTDLGEAMVGIGMDEAMQKYAARGQ